MVVAMVALFVNGVWGEELEIETHIPRIVFYGEAMALSAFGVCWLVASRVLPVLTRPEERHRLFAKDPPGAGGVEKPEARPPARARPHG